MNRTGKKNDPTGQQLLIIRPEYYPAYCLKFSVCSRIIPFTDLVQLFDLLEFQCKVLHYSSYF